MKISNDDKDYEANIVKEKRFYIFKLLRTNDFYTWREPYRFEIFSCSLKCRLKHYKDFKRRTFENRDYSYKMFLNI